MAKTRMLKPDLRTSVKVASWPREVRYFWTLSWGYVDDFGKGLDNLLLIRADCFPLDDDVTLEMLDCWLWRWQQDGVLARYTAGGKDLLQIVNWSEHQKPQHPKPSEYADFSASGSIARIMHEGYMNPSCIGHASFSPELSRDELSRGDLSEARTPPSNFYPSLQLTASNEMDVAPPSKCPEHAHVLVPPKCGRCADARKAHVAWLEAHAPVVETVSGVLTDPVCGHG